MARRQLLGFGNDGTGAPFCVPSDGSDGVFVWNHIDQQAYRLAGTVEEFPGRLAYRSHQHLTPRRELGADPRSRRTLMPLVAHSASTRVW
ncbi:hypothetical protein [Dactylosporangium sp. CA-092794]|uniref:hypothetical protein n=1 Tax=Dactylosporangium sp. CA-092794 TaxID=3239929 RepID=UPI003D8DC0A5